MNPEVIKAALDSFENDDFLHSKDLLRGEIKQAKNNFLRDKLGLKNDIEQQFTELKPQDDPNTELDTELEIERTEDQDDPEPEVKPKKRLLRRKK